MKAPHRTFHVTNSLRKKLACVMMHSTKAHLHLGLRRLEDRIGQAQSQSFNVFYLLLYEIPLVINED